MVHAGGVEGWVKDAGLVFRSKLKSADIYNSNCRKDDIRQWLDEHNVQYCDKDIKTTLKV